MARKRKPAYLKILEGMNSCYGSDERKCSECPYDRYNDRDFYGQGTSYCMEKLNEDAKKWTETMTMFSNCRDCVCWHPELDADGSWQMGEGQTDGLCSVWNVMMMQEEFCSRGAMKD